MELNILPFSSLTNRQLYEILRLRSAVFIVEQQGCYQDLDGIDCEALHIFFQEPDGAVTGCIRIFPREGEPNTVQLGRLVVSRRMQGLGRVLMEAAEKAALNTYGADHVFLTGRRSARGFYEKCGYQAQVPQGYREADAPYFLFRKNITV